MPVRVNLPPQSKAETLDRDIVQLHYDVNGDPDTLAAERSGRALALWHVCGRETVAPSKCVIRTLVLDSLSMESEPLLEEQKAFQVYAARWHMLALFGFANVANAALCFCFAPIEAKAADALNVTMNAVNTLSWSFIALYLPGSLLAQYTNTRYGLRASLLVGSGMGAIACVIRWTGAFTTAYPILLVGQLLAGLSQPFLLNVPPKLASFWFPVRDRDTATAIGALTNPIGSAIGQISPNLFLMGSVSTLDGIRHMLLFQGAWAVAAFVWVFLCMKEYPPTPPTRSAELQRGVVKSVSMKDTMIELKAKMIQLIQNRNFALLVCGFALGVAIFNSFLALTGAITAKFGFDSDQAGYFGFAFLLSGLLGSGIAATLMDRTHAYIPLLRLGIAGSLLSELLLFYALTTSNFIFALGAFCVMGFFMLPILPVTIENAVECTFPVSEDDSAGVLLTTGNMLGVAFIIILQLVNDVSKPDALPTLLRPLNLLVLGVSALSLTFFFLYNGPYNRLRFEGGS